MKTDHFFCRETFPHPKFQLIYVYKMAKLTPPLKFFLEVIHKNKDRILIRIHGRTQKALNWLKIWPTDLERFLDCHFIFICLSVDRFFLCKICQSAWNARFNSSSLVSTCLRNWWILQIERFSEDFFLNVIFFQSFAVVIFFIFFNNYIQAFMRLCLCKYTCKYLFV